jgi:exonuclease VII small subunit
MDNAKAFNKLMGIEQAPLDVPNPVIRLDRGDLEGAVKIITDYWYKFDNIHRVEFKEKIDKLSKVVIELIETLSYWGNNEDYLDKLKQIVKDLENSSPSNAIHILNNLRNIMKICDEIIEKVNKEIEDINKISSEYKQFEFKVPTELKLLNNLKIRQDFNTIEEYISFISDISAFLKRHIDYLKQDEQQLLIISLYPLGDYIISKLLEEDKEVYLDELPFTKPVANLYAKLYSILHNNVKYDEDKEVIKYANM